jgi:hypothetical protein
MSGEWHHGFHQLSEPFAQPRQGSGREGKRISIRKNLSAGFSLGAFEDPSTKGLAEGLTQHLAAPDEEE